MKKILCLILVLLAVSTAKAAELYPTLTACRHEMRRMLGLDTASVNSLPDTAANQYLRAAIVHCAPEVIARRYTKKTITVNQVYNYSLDSIIRVVMVEMKYGDSLKPVLFMPRQEWYKQSHRTTRNQTVGDLSRPSYYDFDDSNITLYPFPSRADSLFITGAVKVQSIDSLTSLSRYPEKLRLTFIWYACYLHLLSKYDARRNEFYQQYQMQKNEVEKVYRRETDSDNTSTR